MEGASCPSFSLFGAMQAQAGWALIDVCTWKVRVAMRTGFERAEKTALLRGGLLPQESAKPEAATIRPFEVHVSRRGSR